MSFRGSAVPPAASVALNRKREIVPLPEKFTAGDLCDQGLPEFFGILELSTTFDLPEKDLLNSRLLEQCFPAAAALAIRQL